MGLSVARLLPDLRRVFNGLVKVPQLQVARGPVGVQSWDSGVEPDGQAVSADCSQVVLPPETVAGEQAALSVGWTASPALRDGESTHSALSFNQSGFLCGSCSSCSSAASAVTCRASACLLSHCGVHTHTHTHISEGGVDGSDQFPVDLSVLKSH